MNKILEKLNLSRHADVFLKEKITPDIICDLSIYDMACLGVHNRADVMKIRTACIHFGNHSIRRTEERFAGPPQFLISRNTLEGLIDTGYMVKEISELLSVSESTVYRRMRKYGLKKRNFSEIDDRKLVAIVNEVLLEFPRCGEKMLREILRQQDVFIPRYQLRDMIQTHDKDGVINRTLRRLHRRVYHVEGPNHLWHVDTNHKLIRWYIIISAGVDGFSRMIMFIRALDNNRADTLCNVFLEAVDEFGTPLRLRTDMGMENCKIADYMQRERGADGMITGKSVHNQRVERMWRDVYDGVLAFYSELFSFIEDSGLLDIMNPLHVYALHHVYKLKINEKLRTWRGAWNTHRMRTVGTSPIKLWTSGMVNNPVETPISAGSYMDENTPNIVSDLTRPVFGRSEVQISDHCKDVLERECPYDWTSANYGIDVYTKAVSIIEEGVIINI